MFGKELLMNLYLISVCFVLYFVISEMKFGYKNIIEIYHTINITNKIYMKTKHTDKLCLLP